jgi:hypothetical protein
MSKPDPRAEQANLHNMEDNSSKPAEFVRLSGASYFDLAKRRFRRFSGLSSNPDSTRFDPDFQSGEVEKSCEESVT